MPQREDWYAYLRLSPEATTEQIEQAVERLSRQATALAVTAPERSQLLRETVRSIKRDLLSGAESRQRYDAALAAAVQQAAPPPAQPSAFPPPPAPAAQPSAPPAQPSAFPPPPAAQPSAFPPPPSAQPSAFPPPPSAQPSAFPPPPALAGEGIGSRLARFLRTGWTCSACGKDALPSDKFCTKCGSPIKPVQPDPAPSRARLSCANCGGGLGARDAFCPKCGTRTAT